jgi:MoaD family protein
MVDQGKGAHGMVRVTVRSFLTMEEIIGEGEIALPPEESTVDGLLQELSRRHGEAFSKRIFSPKTGNVQSYWIVVNGRHRKETDSKLHDGDEVVLYPAWAGG